MTVIESLWIPYKNSFIFKNKKAIMKSSTDEEKIQPIRNLRQKYLLNFVLNLCIITKRYLINLKIGLTNPLRMQHQKTDWYGPPNGYGR